MDLSLDDFIKRKNIKIGSQKPRRRLQQLSSERKNNIAARSNKPLLNKNARKNNNPPRRNLQQQNTNQPRRSFSNKSGGMLDARVKIIQKSRQRITDARDKLSEIAKLSDARSKIKGRNLKGKMNTEIRERGRGIVGRGNFNKSNISSPQILQRSIRNPAANLRGNSDPNSLIRCTINRPVTDYSVRPTITYNDDYEMDLPIPVQSHKDLSSIKVVTQNEYTHFRQQEYDYSPSAPEPLYVEHYEPPPVFNRPLNPRPLLPRSTARMSQEMRARLDSPAKQFTVAPSSLPSTLGHRIVVSNLHPSVTHEDIKELFEDIGPLLTSRLVRAGVAEVVYQQQKDAKKAVEAYHNRQLDGQPMKCLLVNSRTQSSGVLRSTNMPLTPKFPGSSQSTVVPDISAIHKALFMSK